MGLGDVFWGMGLGGGLGTVLGNGFAMEVLAVHAAGRQKT